MALRMLDLTRALEQSGLKNVRTLLSSGNAIFDSHQTRCAALEGRIEHELERLTGRTFHAFVRSSGALAQIVARTGHPHPAGTKRVVVFLRGPAKQGPDLPVHRASWALLAASGAEAYGFYTPGRDSSAFMAWLEKTFGPELTTRTSDTVRKCSAT